MRLGSLATLAELICTPGEKLAAAAQNQVMVCSTGHLLHLCANCLKLLDKKRRRCKFQIAVVETKLAVGVAADGEELPTFGQDQGVLGTACYKPDENVEAQALGDADESTGVVAGWILAVTELAVVVRALREKLSVSILSRLLIKVVPLGSCVLQYGPRRRMRWNSPFISQVDRLTLLKHR